MTISNYQKAFKQLENKPIKLIKYIKHNTPKKRSFSVGSRRCTRCERFGAHIQKYRIHLCRQCFRDIAKKIGFKKYS